MSKEIECIQIAHEAKLVSAQQELDGLQNNGEPFDNPLSGVGSIDWRDEPAERIKQILIMPIAFLLITFMALLVPLAYISHLREIRSKRRHLKNQILNMSKKPLNIETPRIKTLESLWRLHGLDEYKYSHDERLELLSKWVETLYGNSMKTRLSLTQRVRDISARNTEANRPYYEGKEGAMHYHFVNPLDALIKDLSQELPNYNDISN